MKTSITLSMALVVLTINPSAAAAVTEQNAWHEVYVVQSATPNLVVSNIWGSVTVRTGQSGQITVAAIESRSAPDQERFQRSFESIALEINADANGVSLLVGNPNERWHRMGNCDGCRLDIQFDVLVPPGTNVDVATVMDGRVDIDGVAGLVTASNVNGPVDVDNIQNCKIIESVNGNVTVGFSRNPVHDCRIASVNGDITLGVPDGTGLNVTLDLFNGDVTSEVAVGALDLPATIEQSVKNGHKQYHIQKLSGLRIGAGGPTYSISSINGDVLIQKHQ